MMEFARELRNPMARLARVEVFSPEEVAVVHVMNRVVRRCFLLGDDPVTGKNYDHRKDWIENLLRHFSASFGIDLLGFAILSNHFHLILRSRPDVVATWNDDEVARRWLNLCPVRKTPDGLPAEPNEAEINSIRNHPQKLATVRSRLSDIGWWMRLLCQQVATRANKDDQETGKFFQSRYKAVRLLDEQALLACAAYVDLNPIRAAMAETLETSDYTSAQRRIQAVQAVAGCPLSVAREGQSRSVSAASTKGNELTRKSSRSAEEKKQIAVAALVCPDGFLSPVALEERTRKPGPAPSRTGLRCSDKGFLPISEGDYLALVDWTSRHLAKGKRGATPKKLRPLFERLSLDPKLWCQLVGSFGKLFSNVAGLPETIEATTSRLAHKRYYVRSAARTLFSPPGAPSRV